MDDLTGMGFGLEWRKKVLASTMTGFKRVLHKERQGITTRNRLGSEICPARRVRRLCGKSTWYTKRNDPEIQAPEEGSRK